MTFMLARRGATILRRLTSQCPQNIVCASIRDQNEVLVTSAVAASPLRLMKLYSTPVARPKAHTGRAAASKKARSGESKTATDNSEKKSKKTTKSKKETTGSKKKIKTVKSATRKLTDKQKEERAKYKQKQEIKQLKVAMLSPPKTLPNNAFGLVLQQTEHGTVAQRTEVYRGLSAAERESLRQTARENTEANRVAFDQWVKSHTPLQIKEANAARRRLRTLLNRPRSFADIRDSRQVKRPRPAFILYAVEKFQSGEFDHLEPKNRVSAIGKSWRNLTEADHERYRRLHEDEVERYKQEYESVYGQPPKLTFRAKQTV